LNNYVSPILILISTVIKYLAMDLIFLMFKMLSKRPLAERWPHKSLKGKNDSI
jgi:hypothetical protein